MIEKLEGIEERLDTVNQQLCNPDVISDQENYTKLMREMKQLEPVVEKFRAYKAVKAQNEEAFAMFNDASEDAELREMAQEEWNETSAQLDTIYEELKVMLLPRDPNDDKKRYYRNSCRCRRRRGGTFCS